MFTGPVIQPPVNAHWPGRAEIRADLRSSAGLVLGLAHAGVPAGLLWWLLAPRADFRITEAGPAVIGTPSQELLVAGDGVYTLVLGALGLITGAAAWRLRRRRGVATVLALALGATVTAVVAWQVGELLGQGPSDAELADVGGRVTSALRLGGLPALAVAPFAAVAAYLVPVLMATGDDLGRTPIRDHPAGEFPQPTTTLPGAPVETDRHLVDAPPPGRPQA